MSRLPTDMASVLHQINNARHLGNERGAVFVSVVRAQRIGVARQQIANAPVVGRPSQHQGNSSQRVSDRLLYLAAEALGVQRP